MTAFTPGPWQFYELPNPNGADGIGYIRAEPHDNKEIAHHGDSDRSRDENVANAHLIVAAPDLLEAAQLQEAAETQHANCEECEGLGVPELCRVCFPFFDDARVKRRLAIAKATP